VSFVAVGELERSKNLTYVDGMENPPLEKLRTPARYRDARSRLCESTLKNMKRCQDADHKQKLLCQCEEQHKLDEANKRDEQPGGAADALLGLSVAAYDVAETGEPDSYLEASWECV
jgi:hypothetical protein